MLNGLSKELHSTYLFLNNVMEYTAILSLLFSLQNEKCEFQSIIKKQNTIWNIAKWN